MKLSSLILASGLSLFAVTSFAQGDPQIAAQPAPAATQSAPAKATTHHAAHHHKTHTHHKSSAAHKASHHKKAHKHHKAKAKK